MLRRVFDMKSDGFDFNSARRALKEAVRFSTSVGVSVSAAGVLGRITVHVVSFHSWRRWYNDAYLPLARDTYSACQLFLEPSHPPPSISLPRLL